MRTAAVLAGGMGTRLRPVVADRPKVLAPVAGRRFLAYLLDQLADAGFEKAVLCTGYLGGQVEAAFGARWRRLHLKYSQEPNPLGTAGALRYALDELSDDDIFVLNGDSFCDVNLEGMGQFHRVKGAKATLAHTQVSDVSRYGAVKADAAGRIFGFGEKGSAAAGFINAGVYVINRQMIAEIPDGATVSLERECFPRWVEGGLWGFRAGRRFLDIGTPESFAEAQAVFAPPPVVAAHGQRRPYVLLDRDGTINVERNYLSDPAQLELLPGALGGLKKFRSMGAGLAVISNQAGIGRGYFDRSVLVEIHDRLRAMMGDEDVAVDGIYFCPHAPDERCGCRKPKVGMAEQAASELGFDPARSFVVGDKRCDIELGRRLGATTILVRTGYGSRSYAEGVVADYTVHDLSDAAEVVSKLLNERRPAVATG